ncbi:MAG: hypothetical protein PVI23_10655 [Maricaulaceae bacterium]|jgi:hypothetical protein
MRAVTAVSVSALLIACSPDSATAQSEAELNTSGSPAATADEALAALGLAQSGSGILSFASVETQGSAQVFSNVTFEAPDGDGGFTAETLRLVNPRTDGDGVVFDGLEILNLAGGDDEFRINVDRWVLVEPNPAIARIVAMAFAGEEPDEDYDWGAPSDYGFAAFEISGVSMAGEGDDADLENLSIGSISLRDFAAGQLGSFLFENLDIAAVSEEGEDVSITLGEFSINGLDLAALDEIAEMEDFDDEEAFQNALLNSGLSDPYKKYYDDYALRAFALSVDGVNVGLESYAGELQQTRVGLESVDTLRGLTVSFDDAYDSGAQALQALAMLGYEGFTVEGDFVQTMNEVEDRVASDEFSLRIIDALTFEADYDFGGIGDYVKNAAKLMDASAEIDPSELNEAIAPLILSNFELRLTDESIVERALNAVAEQQGSTPERVRQQAIGMLALGSITAPPELQPIVSDAIEAATAFLETPGSTLRIALAPEEPLQLSDVVAAFEQGDIEGGVSLLNVQIEASE